MRTFPGWMSLVSCLLIAGACGRSSPEDRAAASVAVTVGGLGTAVETVVLTVDAADIEPPLVFNLKLRESVAVGTLRIPPGVDRVVMAVAYESDGAVAAEGSVTIPLVGRGANPPVTIPMVPRPGHVPVTIQLGAVAIAVTPTSSTLAVGETLRLAARVLAADGAELTVAPEWATTDPTVLSVSQAGLVTALRAGQADVVATYAGVAGLGRVSVGTIAPWVGLPVIGDATPRAVAVDAAGNVYVAGETRAAFPGFGNAGGRDAFLAKLDASGAVTWVVQVGTSGDETVVGVAVDGLGTATAYGTTDGAFAGYANAGQRDAFVAVVEAGGDVAVRQLGTTGDEQGIALATGGAVVVSGMLLGDRAYVATLDGAGVIVGYGELDDGRAYGSCASVVLDTRGSAWVAGRVYQDVLPIVAPYVARIQLGSGAFSVAVVQNQAEFAYPSALAVDRDGNAYLAGVQETVAHSWEGFVTKLDASLAPSWGPSLPFGIDSDAAGVALDGLGNVYVSGSLGPYLDSTDAFVMKLDRDGNVVWPPRTFGTPDWSEWAGGMAIDAHGDVFAAAETAAGGVVAKLDPLGLLQ